MLQRFYFVTAEVGEGTAYPPGTSSVSRAITCKISPLPVAFHYSVSSLSVEILATSAPPATTIFLPGDLYDAAGSLFKLYDGRGLKEP